MLYSQAMEAIGTNGVHRKRLAFGLIYNPDKSAPQIPHYDGNEKETAYFQIVFGNKTTSFYQGDLPSEDTVRARLGLSKAEFTKFLLELDPTDYELFIDLFPLFQPRKDLADWCAHFYMIANLLVYCTIGCLIFDVLMSLVFAVCCWLLLLLQHEAVHNQ